ncbi:hypothetical protein [Streptomyces sp. NPDC057052]|uniref:hypothetical protein n=1 Tax=Streptomyces sp. NPDC057052 TaxID=3346010 RepID=UPI003638146E
MHEPTVPASREVADKEHTDRLLATAFRDDTPIPAIGSTPPVPQPGRPAMSSKATDDSVRMIAFGGMTLMMCAGGGIVMVTSEFADPAVIGMICAAPAVVALPILAVARLLRGARPEPEVHHHYEGTVLQQTTHSRNTGLWARTDNRQ